MKTVEKNVRKKNLNVYYEANVVGERSKRVYCYISPRVCTHAWLWTVCISPFFLLKQLQVKEYFMRFIPTRTFTCKVSPSTQVSQKSGKQYFTWSSNHLWFLDSVPSRSWEIYSGWWLPGAPHSDFTSQRPPGSNLPQVCPQEHRRVGKVPGQAELLLQQAEGAPFEAQ